jgi:hypothetical protein
VAVINNKGNSSLHALTLAALALPGLLSPTVALAEDDEVSFQYGHYQEGKRHLYNVKNTKNPIEVDSVLGKARVSLTDRIKFAFNYTQDTWSGATPITTAPLAANGNRAIEANTASGQLITGGASPYITNNRMLLNKNFVPLAVDANGNQTATRQPVHVLATASPETRKQGDFNVGYEWDEAAVNMGGGISVENDYESRFGNLGGRWDFNQKLTTLNAGLSYTNSDTAARLDHDAEPYITKTVYEQQIENTATTRVLHGNREDWATRLGLTQVLNKNAWLETSVGFTRSTGYMANPYKVMTIVFADPDSLGTDSENPQAIVGDVKAFLEQRPNERNQLNLGGRYIQHIAPLDAALHLDYRFFHDDWGINAHTFEADWVQPIANTWTVTPKVRYYTQDAADFYQPYLISRQAFAKPIRDDNGIPIGFVPYDSSQLPRYFSSDQRLSGFGALSGGVTVNKKLSKAVNLEAGFEYYTHAGSLKLGGGGEGSYSDFGYYLANAALNVNLSALDSGGSHGDSTHTHAAHHTSHHQPAGVMFAHMLNKTDEVMVGYRYLYSRQAGELLHGTDATSDNAIRNDGCVQAFSKHCRVAPTYMDMHMHMLDIMYAPSDWLNLMLMPQFMDMDMDLRMLKGVKNDPFQDHIHGDANHSAHATGGVGDTGLYALFKLFDRPAYHVHLTLGMTAPTGDVDIKLRRMHQKDEGLIHYGMQLGSGTWDFKPSLTYTGHFNRWSYGAQLNATTRLGQKNDSGYALGDIFQATMWGGYNLTHWLSASLRGVYTEQGTIDGQFKPVAGIVNNERVNNVNPGSQKNYSAGPMDYGNNYGGRYWDVGFGLNATVPSGDLQGNSLGVEWLQPVQDDVSGYQLQREGALSATWHIMF